MAVAERGEVELYGVRYPILGPVQRVPVNPFPGKITIGDYTRDDEQVASSWVQASWSGGLGIEQGTYPRDQDRFWYSTLDTRWPRSLALGPAIGEAAADVAAAVGRTCEFLGEAIVSLGAGLYRLTGAGLVALKTYTGDITDLVVSGGKLWIAGPDFDLEAYDGTNFTAEAGKQFVALADLGGWLYGLEMSGTMQARNPSDGTWSASGNLQRPPGWAEQLVVYTAPNGDFTLYAVGADGLYVWDATTGRFFLTTVTWPVGLPVGRAAVWRSELYVPVGPSIYRYNGQVVVAVGPDKDEGLPPELPDRVVAVYPSHSMLVALVVGRTLVASAVGRDEAAAEGGLRAGTRLATPRFGVVSRASRQLAGVDPELVVETLVLGTSGASWHTLATAPGYQVVGLGAAVVDGRPRILWHDRPSLAWIELPPAMVNPLRPQLVATRPWGALISPWFDAGWAEIDKQAIRLKVRAEVATPELPITVSWQTDVGQAWERAGRVTAPGETELELGPGGRGVTFRRIRLRLEMERLAGEATATPIVSSVALSFLRRPATRYAFSFTVNLSGPWRDRSATELRDALLAAAESPEVGSFSFADDPVAEHLVTVSRLQFLGAGGMDGFEGSAASVGRAAVSVIEV